MPSPTTPRKLETELQSIGRRLDALIARVRGAEQRVRGQSLRQLEALKRRRAAAKLALARLRRQSAAARGPVQAGLKKAWRDIEGAVAQAKRRFRRAA